MRKTVKLLVLVVFIFVTCISCSKDEEKVIPNYDGKFYPLNPPYILCIGQNPGGIVFDFIYNGEKAGANNFDYPSVKDIDPDLMIKNSKCKLPQGMTGGGGMPHFRLCKGASAINYTEINPKCKGFNKYEELIKSEVMGLKFKEDDSSFDLSKLELTDWGVPSYKDMINEFKKLVIGNIWKKTAHNDIEGDELIWIIKTKEGEFIKMIVTMFPAKNKEGRTLNGNIDMQWDILN